MLIDEQSYGCSFGSQSNSELGESKVVPRLGADGQTFTTEVDATDSESYTYFDLAQQLESNDSDYWMKFSSTDIYLEVKTWVFVDGAVFGMFKQYQMKFLTKPKSGLNGMSMTCQFIG